MPPSPRRAPSRRRSSGSAADAPRALPRLTPAGGGDPIAITVQGDRILAVGDPVDGAAPLEVPSAVTVGEDLWVIPGFVDSHVHLQFSSPEAVLAGGVTAVRDLGGPPSAAQSLVGATPLTVLIAGRILTPPGGYPTESWGADGTGREVLGVDDAEAAVAEQVAAGASVVKVALEDGRDRPLFDVATVAEVVAAADRSGLRTTAHVGSAAALDVALEAGVHELCHLPLHDVTPGEMVRVAEAGVLVVPTLGIREPDDGGAVRALRAFLEAGGRVLYGSDLGNEGTAPGISVTEVELVLAAGMTPREVLASATADAAAHHGLDAGRLEPGRRADLVVLGADPLADPRAYDDVRLVLAGGVVVAP